MASITDQLVTIVFGLAELNVTIPQLNISLPVLELVHAVLINYAYRTALRGAHTNIGWGQGFLATVVMSAGGGSTVALLRGEPLGILKSNRFWGIYGTTYWLMFSNPYAYPLVDYLFSIPAVEQVLTLSDGILRNMAVTKIGIEGVAVQLGDDKWVAKLICGTLAGCGSGFWIDTFKLTQAHWSFSTPRFLHSPSIDMKASFASTLFYLVTTNHDLCTLLGLPSLTEPQAHAWGAIILSSGLVYKSYIDRINTSNRFNRNVPTPTTSDPVDEKKDD